MQAFLCGDCRRERRELGPLRHQLLRVCPEDSSGRQRLELRASARVGDAAVSA